MAAAGADRNMAPSARKPAERPRPRKPSPRNNFSLLISTETESHVSSAESLQKRGEARLALRQSGGRAPHFHSDDTGQEVARGTARLDGAQEMPRDTGHGRSAQDRQQ